MKHFAIVEDEKKNVDILTSYIKQYMTEKKMDYEISVFNEPVGFLEKYDPTYDIIFMDIKMPNMNGLEASKLLRKKDATVILIFVTDLAQFAIRGYEVGALDFIVKPLLYKDFVMKIHKALEFSKLNEVKKITIKAQNQMIVIDLRKLKYVEVLNRTIIYHLDDKEISAYGKLKDNEDLLSSSGFAKINSSFMVNYRYVKKVSDNMVFLHGGGQLQLSRGKKKEFLIGLTNFLGGGGV